MSEKFKTPETAGEMGQIATQPLRDAPKLLIPFGLISLVALAAVHFAGKDDAADNVADMSIAPAIAMDDGPR